MRTPSSRTRFRRPGAVLALVVLAAAAWIAATGLASASTSGHRAAKLALVGHDPATVRGTGFKPRARVRVTFDGTQVRRPVTNAHGAVRHGHVPDGRRSLHDVVGHGEPARTRDGRAEGTGKARVRTGLGALAAVPPAGRNRPAPHGSGAARIDRPRRSGGGIQPRSARTNSGFKTSASPPLCRPSGGRGPDVATRTD